MGGWMGCISETIRYRKLILGRDLYPEGDSDHSQNLKGSKSGLGSITQVIE